MKILSVAQMTEVDRRSSEEYGLPSILLMENAGFHCFRALQKEFAEDLPSLQVSVVCGKGNNGGDGLVVARQLFYSGSRPQVFLLGRLDEMRGDAAVNAQILTRAGFEIRQILDEDDFDAFERSLLGADIVVDALLGTGLSKPLRGDYARAVEAINQSRTYRLSVDIPSGMFSDSLESKELSVWADRTVTFTAPKIAHVLSSDLERMGEVDVVSIGSPEVLLQGDDYALELIDEEMAAAQLLSRDLDSYKGNYGHLLLLGGSRGKSGAVAMAARAALRSGAGLVTAAVPRGIQSEVAGVNPEVMTEGLAEDPEGALDESAWDALAGLLEGKTALAIGPGLSLRPGAAGLVRRVLLESPLPVVVDAGGVDALRDHLDLLRRRSAPVILTPHPGEFSRLTGVPIREIVLHRLELARDFAREDGVWLVLKGFRSILATPSGRIRVCPLGNPGMATAGMGDVLTGVIGGLLAGQVARKSADPALSAATAGLFVHSLAGDLAAADKGLDGLIAGDVIAALPQALALLRERDS